MSVSVLNKWLTAKAAAEILEVPGAKNVRRLADRGCIEVRQLPGVRAIYSRSDVEALAQTARTPAIR